MCALPPQGSHLKSVCNECMTQGIPYGEAPVGQLRLQPPVPKGAWGGILTAVEEGPECLQEDSDTKSLRRGCTSINARELAGQTICLLDD